MDSIRIKRGLKLELPESLPLGEPAFCTDTKELYIGMGEGQALRKVVDQEVLSQINNLNLNKRDVKVKINNLDMDTSHESRKLGLVNLKDEVIEAIAGTSPVIPTIEDGSVTNEKYADASITEDKIGFFEEIPTINVFNAKATTRGFYHYLTGDYDSSGNYRNSWYAVNPGDVVRTSHSRDCYVSYWNEAREFVSGVLGLPVSGITIPEGCYWVNLTHHNNSSILEKTMVTINNPLPSTYIPYCHYLLDSNIFAQTLEGKCVNESNINFMEKVTSHNLINPSTMIYGYYSLDGTYNNNSSYLTSDYIPVSPGEIYTFSYTGHVTYWSESLTFVTGYTGSSTITVPSNEEIKYARFTFLASKTEHFVYKGRIAKPYVPHTRYKLKNSIELDADIHLGYNFLKRQHLSNDIITDNHIESVSRNKLQYYKSKSENLFDPSCFITGGYYNEKGVWTPSTSYDCTTFIKVEPNTEYYSNMDTYIVFFNANKEWLDGKIQGNSFTTPEDCVYITKPIYKVRDYSTQYILPRSVENTNENIRFKCVDPSLEVETSNIACKSVTTEHIEFLNGMPTVNLFNKNKARLNGYYAFDSGTWNTSPNYCSSDFMQVKPNTSYTSTYHGHWVFWDVNKTYISGVNSRTCTTPSNCAYITATFSSSDIDTHMLVEGTTLPPEYMPHTQYTLDESKVEVRANTYFQERRTSNLYDKTKWSHGYNHWEDGRFVNDTETYGQSDFIEVVEGETYKVVHSTYCFVTFWDANKRFVSGLNRNNSFTVPTGLGIKYIRSVVRNVNKDIEMILPNSVSSGTYIPYTRMELSEEIYIPNVSTTSRLSKLNWAVLGDSITTTNYGGQPYWYHISNRTGINVYNHGISGSRIAKHSSRTDEMCTRYANMENDADIITIFGGTNDYGANMPLGNINSTDVTTFYGALNVMIEGLINKYPGKGIGYLIPMRRKGMTNSTNKAKFETYVNAIIEVCEKYSIPYLDLYRAGGLNPDISVVNTQFFHNQDGLHPNNEGHKALSYKIEQFILGL